MAAPSANSAGVIQKQFCTFARSCTSVSCDGEQESISSCRTDTLQHLRRCKSSPFHAHVVIPEGLLLLFRSGLFSMNRDVIEFKICQNHKKHLGRQWVSNRRRCCHPLHPPTHKEKPDRGITCSMSKEIWLHERIVVPVGSG